MGPTTRTNFGGAPWTSVGIGRLPPIEIVAPTSVISSAVLWTMPWPIAEEPTERSSVSELRGIVGSAAPGIDDGWLKPKRSAIATSFAPPSFAPSGANTELHELAKDWSRVPPHDSPLAFWRLKPSMATEDCTGKVSVSLTMWAWSAAVAVIIFIVEPGGWSAEKATPASASSSPVRGSMAAIPA